MAGALALPQPPPRRPGQPIQSDSGGAAASAAADLMHSNDMQMERGVVKCKEPRGPSGGFAV